MAKSLDEPKRVTPTGFPLKSATWRSGFEHLGIVGPGISNNARPEQFIDESLVRELEQSGFYK